MMYIQVTLRVWNNFNPWTVHVCLALPTDQFSHFRYLHRDIKPHRSGPKFSFGPSLMQNNGYPKFPTQKLVIFSNNNNGLFVGLLQIQVCVASK